MYPLETRELAVEAVAAGFSLTEAAELAGCSRTAVVNWAKAAGVAPPPRKKAVYLPFDRKMELVARLEAGERAADLAAEAGVTAAAVSGWRRRLREEGALSLMTDSDIAARAPEPREAPSELEELRARCEELELRNAVLEGTIDILKKDPGADLSALTAAERAALADRLRGRFGLRAALAALSLPRMVSPQLVLRAHAGKGTLPPPAVWRELVAKASGRYGLDPRLIAAVIKVESNFETIAESEKGAQGLMQLMPGTQQMLGVIDPFDPEANVDAGSRYLRQQIDRFGRLDLALAAYNAGPGNVLRYGGIPPFAETQAYVSKVLSLLDADN